MSDRALLFLFSVFMVIVGLAAAGWLVVSGQAGSVDGLFLLLTCLLAVFAFSCYLLYLIHRAKESLAPAAKPAKATSAAKTAPAASTSQPVETS